MNNLNLNFEQAPANCKQLRKSMDLHELFLVEWLRIIYILKWLKVKVVD